MKNTYSLALLIVLLQIHLFGYGAESTYSSEAKNSTKRIVIYHDGTKAKVVAFDTYNVDWAPSFIGMAQIKFENGNAEETLADIEKRAEIYYGAQVNNALKTIASAIEGQDIDEVIYTYKQKFTVPYMNLNEEPEEFYITYSLLVEKGGQYSVLQNEIIPASPKILVAYHIGRNTGEGDLPSIDEYEDTTLFSMVNFEGDVVPLTRDSVRLTIKMASYVLDEWKTVAEDSITDRHRCVAGTLPDDRKAISPYIPNIAQLATIYINSTAVTIAAVICEGETIKEVLNNPNYRTRSVVETIFGALDNYSIDENAQRSIKNRDLFSQDCSTWLYENKWDISYTPVADIYFYRYEKDYNKITYLQQVAYNEDELPENISDLVPGLSGIIIQKEFTTYKTVTTTIKNSEILFPEDWLQIEDNSKIDGVILDLDTLDQDLSLGFIPGIVEHLADEDTVLAQTVIVIEKNKWCYSNGAHHYHCWGDHYKYPGRGDYKATIAFKASCLGGENIKVSARIIDSKFWRPDEPEVQFIASPGSERKIFSAGQDSSDRDLVIYFDGNRGIKADALVPPADHKQGKGEHVGCKFDTIGSTWAYLNNRQQRADPNNYAYTAVNRSWKKYVCVKYRIHRGTKICVQRQTVIGEGRCNSSIEQEVNQLEILAW